ncbi:hypothetical protein HPB47_012297 [Ixodes persulcatus]|uniref:Uncharacterized protein n=1 Tax=Ixodes persulcatus TaxID=34615 RepID=A0AC60NTZ5_IXOPE|nr:hypothetical protein HPB47_012297 [Ixodes persulcatus]
MGVRNVITRRKTADWSDEQRSLHRTVSLGVKVLRLYFGRLLLAHPIAFPLEGIAVLAYEPLPRESAAGVIYEVPADLTEVELQLAVHTTAPVISIRRLSKSETVELVFSTDTLLEKPVTRIWPMMRSLRVRPQQVRPFRAIALSRQVSAVTITEEFCVKITSCSTLIDCRVNTTDDHPSMAIPKQKRGGSPKHGKKKILMNGADPSRLRPLARHPVKGPVQENPSEQSGEGGDVGARR